MTKVTWERLNEVLIALQLLRYKKDTDYSVIFKYGEVIVTCAEVFKPEIEKVFMCACVPITHLLTYAKVVTPVEPMLLTSLDLPPIALYRLHREGFFTVEDIKGYGIQKLTLLTGIGPTTVKAVKDAFIKAGVL